MSGDTFPRWWVAEQRVDAVAHLRVAADLARQLEPVVENCRVLSAALEPQLKTIRAATEPLERLRPLIERIERNRL